MYYHILFGTDSGKYALLWSCFHPILHTSINTSTFTRHKVCIPDHNTNSYHKWPPPPPLTRKSSVHLNKALKCPLDFVFFPKLLYSLHRIFRKNLMLLVFVNVLLKRPYHKSHTNLPKIPAAVRKSVLHIKVSIQMAFLKHWCLSADLSKKTLPSLV